MSPDHEQLLAQLWREEYAGIRGSAQKRLKDRQAAEDVAMQSFVQLGEALEKGGDVDPPRLLRLISNGLIVDALRRDRRSPASLPLAQVSEEQLGVDTYLTPDRLEFQRSFDDAVRRLPVDEADAFILTHVRGLTQHEAAAVLGVDQATVSRKSEIARLIVKEAIS